MTRGNAKPNSTHGTIAALGALDERRAIAAIEAIDESSGNSGGTVAKGGVKRERSARDLGTRREYRQEALRRPPIIVD